MALSFDDDFIHRKELKDVKEVPLTTWDGIKKGFKSLGVMTGSGVSGVITKPYEGAREGNAKGFFTGVGKGLAGLVAKPTAGVVDLVSKTSLGIESGV